MGQVSSRLTGLFNDNAKQTETNNEIRSRKISYFNKDDQHFDINGSETFHYGSVNDTCTLKPISSFATPRLPLKRTREISPITAELPQKILDLISPCCKKLRMDDEHLNFQFLNDSKSLDYLRKCKIMFIMRGIPGSGKSTITKHLRKMYSSMEICSADDFFVVGTDYQYNPNKIGEAHKYCKQKAVNAAVSETMTIIIDNTNTKFWEMKFYLSLAKSFNYIPIIVEPKTPWKNDVKLLVAKNTHNLDEKSIKLKGGWDENATSFMIQCFKNKLQLNEQVEILERSAYLQEVTLVSYRKFLTTTVYDKKRKCLLLDLPEVLFEYYDFKSNRI